MKNKINCKVQGYEDIQFEVGQQWITRGGKVVEITSVFDDSSLTYPVDAGLICYTRKGREHKYRDSENDLITLVQSSVAEIAESAEEPVEYRFEPVDELVDELVDEPVETYKDNADLWEYSECSRIKVEEDSMLAHISSAEPSVEDKMVAILHQLLAQRDRDLEKISLVFDTFIKLEKMK